MRDGEDQVLHVALKRMRKICRIIKCCFMVATIMSALIWVIVVATLLVGWLKSGQEMAGAVLYSVAYGAFVVLVLWNLTRLFNEVDKGEPPFSEAQADRLQSIAIIALAIVILDFLISVGFIFEQRPRLASVWLQTMELLSRQSTSTSGCWSFLLLCTHFRQYFDMLRCYSSSATKPCKGAVMPIIPRLDRVMADRKMSVNELSQRIDISPVNISRMRRGHIKAVRFSTMERICEVLQCQPGDLFEYVSPEPGTEEAAELGAIVNREIEEPARKPIGAVSRTPVNVAN